MHVPQWLRLIGVPITGTLGAAASVATILLALQAFGVRGIPASAALHAAGPYVAILAVGTVVFLALRRHTDRRIAVLRSEIQKAQADADTAVYVLRNPVGLRRLLEMSEMPSGIIVDVKKNAADGDALRLAQRLRIVNARDLGDGCVYLLWQYGGEKPDEKPLDAAAVALALAGDPSSPFPF